MNGDRTFLSAIKLCSRAFHNSSVTVKIYIHTLQYNYNRYRYLFFVFAVLNREDPDWYWIVRSDGQEGFIPSGFVYPADNVIQGMMLMKCLL